MSANRGLLVAALGSGLVMGGFAGAVQAQLVVEDDTFGVPVSRMLEVEAPGVLDNDLYDNEPAADAGAKAELVSSPVNGTLECDSHPGLELCPNGSFTYTANAGFPGSDAFIYEAVVATPHSKTGDGHSQQDNPTSNRSVHSTRLPKR